MESIDSMFVVDTSGYNIFADIRTKANGKENLYIDDQKYIRHNQPNSHGQQRWACTKKNNFNKCRASAKTMEVNGVVMMNIMVAEHSMH